MSDAVQIDVHDASMRIALIDGDIAQYHFACRRGEPNRCVQASGDETSGAADGNSSRHTVQLGMTMGQDAAPTAQANDMRRFCITSAEPVPIELLPAPAVSAAAGPAAVTSPVVRAIAAILMRSVCVGEIIIESYNCAADSAAPDYGGSVTSVISAHFARGRNHLSPRIIGRTRAHFESRFDSVWPRPSQSRSAWLPQGVCLLASIGFLFVAVAARPLAWCREAERDDEQDGDANHCRTRLAHFDSTTRSPDTPLLTTGFPGSAL